MGSPVTWPRRMADDQQWMRQRAARARDRDRPEDLPPQTLVLAPCCNRRVPAFAVEDFRAVPRTEFRGGGRHAALDHDGACGCCRRALFSAGRWTPAKLAAAQGAPEHAVRDLLAKEAVDRAANTGRPIDPTAEYERALSKLPESLHGFADLEHPFGL